MTAVWTVRRAFAPLGLTNLTLPYIVWLMAIHCPRCGLSHDVSQLARQESLQCRCGFTLDASMLETVDDFLRYFESAEERQKANAIQQEAQLICRMILSESCPDVDIEIAMNNLAEKVEALFPDKMETYRMIYEARFKRLWSQFRSQGPELAA